MPLREHIRGRIIKCACCKKPQFLRRHRFLGDLYSCELDTRPYKSTSFVDDGIDQCADCGFTNFNISCMIKGANETVKSKRYITCDGLKLGSKAAERFVKCAILYETAKDFNGTANAYLAASWVCEEDKMFDTARILRLRAAEAIVEKSQANSGIDERDLLTLSDLLRRSGQHDLVAELLGDLPAISNPFIHKALLFELERAKEHDFERYYIGPQKEILHISVDKSRELIIERRANLINARKERSEKVFKCDLHTHSCFSDGSCTPEELIEIAKNSNVSAVALCDHNTVDGLERFEEAGRKAGVMAVAGVEISTEYKGKDVHIVGLFIKKEVRGRLSDFLKRQSGVYIENNKQTVKRLKDGGYNITFEEVMNEAKDGTVNRVHIAAVLCKKKYAKDIDDAFDTILNPQFGYYIPAKKPDSFKVIEILNEIGAVSVLAHPLISLTKNELEAFLPKAKKHGLIALEALYSMYTPNDTATAKELASKYGLSISGGSDFHGKNRPDTMLGTGQGNLRVPYSVFEELMHSLDR